jgi:signal transduction histidine kinase
MVKFLRKNRENPSSTYETENREADMVQHKPIMKGRGSGRIKLDLLIHDLKGPLSVIEAGTVTLLKRAEKYGSLTEKQERVLTRITRNIKIMQNLVGDALELGRSREGKIIPGRLKISDFVIQTLTEVFDLVQSNTSEEMKTCKNLKELRDTVEKEGLVLTVESEIWNRQVILDEAKVKQILRNLLNNALKYRKNRVELQLNIQNEYLDISVSDDGEGIPAIYHQKIFECYFQLPIADTCSVRGHGLGLAGVMVLLEDMGGELILESDKGTGATFKVKIPLMED